MIRLDILIHFHHHMFTVTAAAKMQPFCTDAPLSLVFKELGEIEVNQLLLLQIS